MLRALLSGNMAMFEGAALVAGIHVFLAAPFLPSLACRGG
jgi:hypothetical protein